MVKTYTAIPVITKGNLIFPNKIIIDTYHRTVSFWKRNIYILGYKKTTLPIRKIASVSIHQHQELLYFSNIHIETYGGAYIVASGFRPKDTREIQRLLQRS